MAKKLKKARYSGIGGQAVLEGIMMKNKDKYSVAVRKANGEIEVDIDEYTGVTKGAFIKNVPFLRGVFNFIDSLSLGIKCLNYSASFYEEEAEQETRFDKAMNKLFKGHADKVLSGFITLLSICFAIGIFIVLPFFLTGLFKDDIRNESLKALLEGLIRIVIFVAYVALISLSKDIKRVYRYHGAEHKCINCVEHGKPLTVENVMHSSRLHRRCGTSFMLLVMLISVICFFFIRVDSLLLKVVIRLLLIPVIAGISYEVLRFAGRHNNLFVRIISAPGMLLQRLTTKEPDESMVEVAIAAVEAVFDWKDFLKEKFGVDVDAPAETAESVEG
ncbi:MAG: DUF1385 domain-containing protein [Lachnospiraceae bacterium]|nr:DUF1385 domain-containing protein [Lachnospiraceae bacterium]MBR5993816.1 DUF1385 domain-containing protein [Lachnospiraceae bacterium]MCR4677482.1 DUF1385 domain-containing protein [Lachnospiraceae bacterium]